MIRIDAILIRKDGAINQHDFDLITGCNYRNQSQWYGLRGHPLALVNKIVVRQGNNNNNRYAAK